MPWTLKHIEWIVDTIERLTTKDTKQIEWFDENILLVLKAA